MKLQQQIKATIGWCISLGVKFVKVVPIITGLVQISTLASQIFLLLAFFLPLKVIILLGSDKTPAYFPCTDCSGGPFLYRLSAGGNGDRTAVP